MESLACGMWGHRKTSGDPEDCICRRCIQVQPLNGHIRELKLQLEKVVMGVETVGRQAQDLKHYPMKAWCVLELETEPITAQGRIT